MGSGEVEVRATGVEDAEVFESIGEFGEGAYRGMIAAAVAGYYQRLFCVHERICYGGCCVLRKYP